MSHYDRMRDYIKTLNEYTALEQEKVEIEERMRMDRLKASLTFTISISRINEVGLDKFQVEGYKNAKMVFDRYRQDGSVLKIKRLRMKAGDDTVHSVLFKY